ncbi:MAG: FkbM family methyltransferase [Chthoniobacterales bacterium]
MDKSYQESVEAVLRQSPKQAMENFAERIAAQRPSESTRFVLCGAGPLGRLVNRRLIAMGRAPLAFMDNRPELSGTSVDGLTVYSPAEAVARFGQDATFVATVYTSSPLREQLQGLNVTSLGFPELAWTYPDTFLPHGALELPGSLLAQADAIRKASGLWSDETSKQEFLGQLEWRTGLEPTSLPPHAPVDETYFASDLFDLTDDEVFVDCGAFDGDSIRAFLQRRGDSFRAAVGLEPDPLTRTRFEKWRSSLPPEQAEKIRLLPYATGERREKLTFDSTGTAASSVGSGQMEVECRPLDEAVAEFKPTFIKMDIEGAEPAALRGAKQIISGDQPILAICLYHAQEHLWQLPLLIHEFNPDYRLFLRRYSDECWEIVCYAVPAARCKS